jgi:dethiobiotin synthetase
MQVASGADQKIRNGMKLFISGIGTGIGKTVVSAIFTEALLADYWKPVQAGDLEFSDAEKVKSLLSNHVSHIHPERFRLNSALSPHIAAELDGIEMKPEDFKLPAYKSSLVIEGAGGLLVPLNRQALMTDLIEKTEAELVLVSRHYLGSINHTLMSWEILKHRNIPIKGIVFNGKENPGTEDIILEKTQLKVLLRIPDLAAIDKRAVKNLAEKITI